MASSRSMPAFHSGFRIRPSKKQGYLDLDIQPIQLASMASIILSRLSRAFVDPAEGALREPRAPRAPRVKVRERPPTCGQQNTTAGVPKLEMKPQVKTMCRSVHPQTPGHVAAFSGFRLRDPIKPLRIAIWGGLTIECGCQIAVMDHSDMALVRGLILH